MRVLVDTPIWSLALRRREVIAPQVDNLTRLLRNDRAILLGPVRQELLSGIRDGVKFRLLRDELRRRPDYPLTVPHFEVAAECANICRAKGVQGSSVDFLICAVSQLDRLPVFTTDKDFAGFAKHLPIRLYVGD